MKNRPWDFEQHFEVDSSGQADAGGYFEDMANRQDERKADAIEREEVRTMVAGAKRRHRADRKMIELTDVPFVAFTENG